MRKQALVHPPVLEVVHISRESRPDSPHDPVSPSLLVFRREHTGNLRLDEPVDSVGLFYPIMPDERVPEECRDTFMEGYGIFLKREVELEQFLRDGIRLQECAKNKDGGSHRVPLVCLLDTHHNSRRSTFGMLAALLFFQ